jgi:NADH dehydrogenase
MQQGSYVGGLIKRRMTGKPAPHAFRYWDKGTMAAVVPGFSVLQAMGIRMAGFLAFLVWGVVHIVFLAMPSNRVQTLFTWIWMMITRRRTDCLIIEPRALAKPPPHLPKPPVQLPGT